MPIHQCCRLSYHYQHYHQLCRSSPYQPDHCRSCRRSCRRSYRSYRCCHCCRRPLFHRPVTPPPAAVSTGGRCSGRGGVSTGGSADSSRGVERHRRQQGRQQEGGDRGGGRVMCLARRACMVMAAVLAAVLQMVATVLALVLQTTLLWLRPMLLLLLLPPVAMHGISPVGWLLPPLTLSCLVLYTPLAGRMLRAGGGIMSLKLRASPTKATMATPFAQKSLSISALGGGAAPPLHPNICPEGPWQAPVSGLASPLPHSAHPRRSLIDVSPTPCATPSGHRVWRMFCGF
jgi:hypothetical protein